MKIASLLAACLLLGSTAFGQNLKRKASFGFSPAPIDSTQLADLGLKSVQGLLINRLRPEGSFAKLGAKDGDVLLTVNGQAVNTYQELVAARGDLREGDALEIGVVRNKKRKTLKGKAVKVPFETNSHGETIYGEFAYKDGWIRTIVNKPKTPGKRPTVFFIPGYTCSSVDNLSSIHPYRKLVDSLIGLDYAVFRMEKPGIGDNTNTGDCFQLGFDNELESYVQGYDQMKQYDFIDPDNIFVWGHSMGGLYAPLVAQKKQPKGVVVYGIVHDTWTEYLLRMIRYQNPRLGSSDYITTDNTVRTLYALLYEHYHLGKSSKELVKNPKYTEILERDFQFDGENQILFRHENFWRELYEYNLSEAWANTEGYVLSMNGEADIETVNNFSQREIVHLVNTYHPGHGEFYNVPKTDHSMIRVGTLEEGAKLRSTPEYREYLMKHFNYDIVTKTHTWIQDKLERSAGD